MLSFFDWMRGRSTLGRTATEIYGSIVAQARQPAFYTSYAVADVAEKRYELIVLHQTIVLARLRSPDRPADASLAQALVEAFVRDLDGSMREMAVGDTRVPAKVRKAAAGLFDRSVLYRDAFSTERPANARENPDEMTLEALIRELIFDGNVAMPAAALARYAVAAKVALEAWTPESGRPVPFPDPAAHL